MAEYGKRYEELVALDADVVALSVDAPGRSRNLARQLRLPFKLLCDPSREVVAAYGLLNNREKDGIAYPATFVLDPDLQVRFRSLDRTAERVKLDPLMSFLGGGAPPTARSRVVPRPRELLRAVLNSARGGIVSPRR